MSLIGAPIHIGWRMCKEKILFDCRNATKTYSRFDKCESGVGWTRLEANYSSWISGNSLAKHNYVGKYNVSVDSQIGLDQRANFTEDTRILYCTTGVLLERLIQTHNFGHFTHIVIDEVHERSKEIDFLLIIIKKLLAEAITKPKVKFILMSATIDADAVSLFNHCE